MIANGNLQYPQQLEGFLSFVTFGKFGGPAKPVGKFSAIKPTYKTYKTKFTKPIFVKPAIKPTLFQRVGKFIKPVGKFIKPISEAAVPIITAAAPAIAERIIPSRYVPSVPGYVPSVPEVAPAYYPETYTPKDFRYVSAPVFPKEGMPGWLLPVGLGAVALIAIMTIMGGKK